MNEAARGAVLQSKIRLLKLPAFRPIRVRAGRGMAQSGHEEVADVTEPGPNASEQAPPQRE